MVESSNNKISDAVEKRKENKNGISLDEKSYGYIKSSTKNKKNKRNERYTEQKKQNKTQKHKVPWP